MKRVCIVMGSDSDLGVMEACAKRLGNFGIPYEVRVISAHRTPAAAEQLAQVADMAMQRRGAALVDQQSRRVARLHRVLGDALVGQRVVEVLEAHGPSRLTVRT